jgi:hypothetical protein
MTSQTSPPTKLEPDKSNAQSAILLAAIVLVVAILAVLFGLQTLIWLNGRHWASVNPWLADTPQPLAVAAESLGDLPPLPSDKRAKKATPVQLKAYDYEFTAPWAGNVKIAPELTFVKFQFDSGRVIVFYDPEGQIDVVGQMKSGKSTQFQQFENVFGEQAPDTNYALYHVIYSASPTQVSPFMHSQDAFRANVLLLWKLSFGFDMQPGIHSLQLGSNSGFEFGDAKNGKPVALRVFDEHDKQFRLIFTAQSGEGAKFTQADINRVVKSLRSIPVLER